MWWVIWAVLVVGTLVGAFFLGRDLLRRVKVLFSRAGRAASVFGDAADRIAAGVDEVAAARVVVGPSMCGDRADLRARVYALRERRAERRVVARGSHRGTWERWERFNE